MLAIISVQRLYFLPTGIHHARHRTQRGQVSERIRPSCLPSTFRRFSAATSHYVCTELSMPNIHFSRYSCLCGCRGGNRTRNLLLMRQARYRFSTLLYIRPPVSKTGAVKLYADFHGGRYFHPALALDPWGFLRKEVVLENEKHKLAANAGYDPTPQGSKPCVLPLHQSAK